MRNRILTADLCMQLFLTGVCLHQLLSLRFRDYFSSKLNIIDACVVVITLVVTMIYTFSDLTGASLIPR